MRTLRGNVFSEWLPSNGYARHNIEIYTVRGFYLSVLQMAKNMAFYYSEPENVYDQNIIS
jgi:hypothetical protein